MTDRPDERMVIHLFQALDALRMYRVIVTAYAKTVHFFEEILGEL